MANTDEPAYMLAARMSVRHQESAPYSVVEALLARIDTLAKENSRLRADLADTVERVN